MEHIIKIGGQEHYQPPMEEVRGLAWNIGGMVARSSFKVERLVAVTRGGMTITECLSRALNIKDIQTFALEVYGKNTGDGNPEVPNDNVTIFREPDLPEDGEGTLFGDDVLDTGLTVSEIRSRWPKAAIGVAYTKHEHKETLNQVDFYGKYVGNIWIDFPWELEAQTRDNLRNGNGNLVL
jgi:xanthine phosphoribosyltransferase